VIPCAVQMEPGEVSIVHYGHGFLGDRREVQGDYLAEMANNNRWVLISFDTMGLTRHDLIMILRLCVNQAHLAEELTDMILQSHLNRLIGEKALQNNLGHVDPIREALSGGVKRIAYYGNSLGGITGGGFVSLSDTVNRAVFGVPGSPYALILRYSDQFESFKKIMTLQAYSDVDIDLLIMITQNFWDPIESSGWLRCYDTSGSEEGYACTEKPRSHFAEKEILIQNGVEDISVPPVTAHLMAKSMHARNLMPPRNIPILLNATTTAENASSASNATEEESGEAGSFLIEWMPERNLHRCLRLQEEAKEQVGLFLERGFIGQNCFSDNGTAPFCVANVTIDESCYIDIGE